MYDMTSKIACGPADTPGYEVHCTCAHLSYKVTQQTQWAKEHAQKYRVPRRDLAVKTCGHRKH